MNITAKDLIQEKIPKCCTIPEIENFTGCVLDGAGMESFKKSGITISSQDKSNEILHDGVLEDLQIRLSFLGKNNIVILQKGCNLKHQSRISIEGNNHVVIIKKGSGISSLNITMRGDNGFFYYGENSTSNYTDCLVHGAVSLCIADDCMLAANTVIRTYDSHAIIDLEKEVQINQSESVFIDHHVWLGQNSIIMPGVTIGGGSIVGAGSIVTKNIDKNALVAGAPARVLKTGVSWTREAFPSKEQIQKITKLVK